MVSERAERCAARSKICSNMLRRPLRCFASEVHAPRQVQSPHNPEVYHQHAVHQCRPPWHSTSSQRTTSLSHSLLTKKSLRQTHRQPAQMLASKYISSQSKKRTLRADYFLRAWIYGAMLFLCGSLFAREKYGARDGHGYAWQWAASSNNHEHILKHRTLSYHSSA